MSYSNGPRIVTNGLVFKMDFANSKCYPGSGTSCYDIGGNSSTGEIVNSPTFTTSNNNKYFSFNGETNSRLIKVPNNTNLDTQTPSVEVWIKTNATNQNGFWFEKGTVNTQYSLFQEGTTILWRHNFGTYNQLTTTTSAGAGINASGWFQVVGTFTSGSRILYVNGIQKNSDSATGTIVTNNGGMSIGVYGGYSGGRDYYYNGDIAIVRVYNKVLTPAEVLNNYNANKGRFGL